MKKTSIIIPCFNQLEYTKLCLESVVRYTDVPYELILIDNASSDGTSGYLKSLKTRSSRREHKKSGRYSVQLIRNIKNLGYAKAINQGIEAAQGDFILFLNNDTVVTEGWLRKMINCAESDPAVGIVGVESIDYAILDADISKSTLLYRNLSQMHKYARNLAVVNTGNWHEVPVVYGFCMLIKKEVVNKIGLLDEQFGVGRLDDDDYCLRAKQKGYRVVCCDGVFIHHFGSRSFFGKRLDAKKQMRKNYEIFFWKWGKKGIEHVTSVFSSPRAERWHNAEKKAQKNFGNFSLSSFVK